MIKAPRSASGALIQGLGVASIFEKTNPRPPNAVRNAVMVLREQWPVRRVHVVGVAVGAGAVQLKQDQARRVVGLPGLGELGFLPHQADDARVASIQPPDANPQRIAARRVTLVVAGQNDPRAEED